MHTLSHNTLGDDSHAAAAAADAAVGMHPPADDRHVNQRLGTTTGTQRSPHTLLSHTQSPDTSDPRHQAWDAEDLGTSPVLSVQQRNTILTFNGGLANSRANLVPSS